MITNESKDEKTLDKQKQGHFDPACCFGVNVGECSTDGHRSPFLMKEKERL
jgi:hypothetical protein